MFVDRLFVERSHKRPDSRHARHTRQGMLDLPLVGHTLERPAILLRTSDIGVEINSGARARPGVQQSGSPQISALPGTSSTAKIGARTCTCVVEIRRLVTRKSRSADRHRALAPAAGRAGNGVEHHRQDMYFDRGYGHSAHPARRRRNGHARPEQERPPVPETQSLRPLPRACELVACAGRALSPARSSRHPIRPQLVCGLVTQST